jgi:glycosyltransferase involved in cell wall biosynthesis
MKMKILHVINDLTTGGAQKMLCKLVLEDTKLNANEHIVLVLLNSTDGIENLLIDNKIKIYYFFAGFANTFKCILLLRDFKPQIIQTWLYGSDLFGLILKLLFPKSLLIWNIRNGRPSRKVISKLSWYSAFICSKLSSIPFKIICPSRTSIISHVDFGYKEDKFVHIPNFIDSEYISSFQEIDNLSFKKKSVIKFGVVTRFDEQKGVDILLKAINELPPNLNIEFILIGSGITKDNIEGKLSDLGIGHVKIKINYCAKKNTLIDFYKNIDFHVSSSRSEAFPNSIFESMFMGKPNIATKAGDSEYLISDFGYLVEINDYKAIAKSILACVDLYNYNFPQYKVLSQKCHIWIKGSYNSFNIIDDYNNVWSNFK